MRKGSAEEEEKKYIIKVGLGGVQQPWQPTEPHTCRNALSLSFSAFPCIIFAASLSCQGRSQGPLSPAVSLHLTIIMRPFTRDALDYD